MANTAADIQKLYIAYFNRPADPNGLTYWMAQGFTLGQIADSFSKQAEYATVFAGKTTEDTVNTIYNNLFGHKADVAGLNYWTGQLLNGKVTLGQAALAILGGATGADKVAVDSKVAAATSFTTAIDTNEEIVAYSLPSNTALAKDWLSKVLDSATQASQIAVQDAVLTSIVNGGGVKDFTLTSNTDVATAENFTAGLVYTPNGGSRVNALQDEDVLTGSNTSATANNKLTATLGNSNDNGAPIITPTLKNIQTATFTFTGSADAQNVNNNAVVAVDLQDGTGLKSIGINRIASTAGTNVARIENIKTVLDTMSLTSTNANNAGTVEFSFGNGTLLGANVGTLNLSDVQVGTVNIGQNTSGTSAAGVGNQGYETLTINSTGNTNNIGTLNLPMDTGTAGKVVITGDKDLTLAQTSNVVNGVTTIESVNYSGGILQAAGRLSAIDASAFKGNLTLNLGNGIFTTGKADTSGSVQNVTITGGSGNDTFYLADTVETGDSITGGDGTDTLIIVNGGNVTAGAAGSSIITKVEALQVLLNNAAAAVDFTKLPDVVGVTVRNVSNTNVAAPANSAPVAGTDLFTLNNLNVAQAAAITIKHSDTGSNGISQSAIAASMANATGANDTIAVTIAEGLNVDPRFNFQLNTNAVENITLIDADTESNTVALGTAASHTGTITIGTTAGAGSATTFLNLDTTVAGNGGLYRIDTTGGAAANIAGVQELSKTAGQIKLIAATIDASAETASVIVRVSTSGAANGAQNIKMGAGNDTVTFDNIQDTRAGLTISDTVVGGAGTDTLVIDGDLTGAALGDTIALGASEWTNVSGFETIRLVGTSNNAGVDGAGNYRLTLTDTLIAANNNAGVLAIVNDNDTANDAANAADTAGTAVESAAVLDARTLSSTSRFSYNGEEGASRTADRIIFSDANFNGSHAINGGAVDNNSTNNSQKNDDVIELRNATNASIGDFNGISNIGNIELTNDTAVTQVSQIQLNDTIVDALVDSYQAANTTTHIERLTIRAYDNVNVANATVGVSIDAGALTAQSALDVALARGANFLSLGAGADRVVLLGNYVAGTYTTDAITGLNLNAQSTTTAVARVVTDTINLGGGNDTLVTYGAINLAGAQLSGIENIVSNSAVVITASQYAALIAARAALSLSGPVLTFSGAGPHQLTIVDDVAGANNIDLSFISITGGTLVYDVTSSSNATGGNVNNSTTSGAVTVSGSGAAIAGTIGTSPSNGGGQAANGTALTAGGTFNGTAGLNENFTGNVAALVGTTVNGNNADSDTITISGGGTVNIGSGNTIINIKTLTMDSTASNVVFFTVANSGITTVNGGSGNDYVDLANSGNSMLAGNINLGTGTNTLVMEGKTYTGTFVAGSGTSDTLYLFNGSNISAANVSGFETVNINNNASVTMTAAQFAGFTTFTAAGTETVNITTTGSIAGNSNVENYVLANGGNTFTAAAGLVSVTGGTGNDTINASSAIIAAAATINGGAGTDTLNVGAVTAALDLSAKVSGVEVINVTGGTTPTWTVTNENGAGVTLNFTKSAATAINNITLGSGGQTLNILGTGTGASTITGGSGADIINLSATATGADVIAVGSTINAIDTINNFKAAGADIFATGVLPTSLFNLTIANADSSSLAAAIATAATAAGASLANTGQAYTITVNSGTAAGIYAFQNTGGSVGTVDTSDFIVKLGGTTGTIFANDFGIANAVAVTPGGTFNGTLGANDLFMSTIPGLNGTTIAGNAADTDVLTLTTAGTVSINNGSTGGTLSNIKVLNLANGTNTITYNTSAGFTTINGGSGDDTFIPNTALLPIVVSGGLGTDTIVLTAAYAATASGSGTFAANVTGFEKLRLTSATSQTIDLQTLGNYSDVTFSGANGLTLSNLPSNGNITLNGAGTSFTISNAAFAGGVNDIVNLSLTDGSTSAVAFATAGITASGVETVNITVNDTQATPTGLFNDNMTWLGNSVKTFNVTGNAGLTLSSSSTSLTTVDASGITLGGFTWTASALTGTATVKGSATGTNTVNMNSATAGVNYTGGAGNDNVTINATVSSTASLGNGNNSMALNGVTILGTYTAGTGTDSLAFFSSVPDISNATITGFENLTVTNNANITATIAQMSQFTGTVNAAGVETLNLTTAGTFNAFSTIEKYNLANGTNNFTSANVAVSVIGGTGADTFNFTANQIINFLTTIDGGNGTDTLNIGATTTQNLDFTTKIAGIEIINVAGSIGTASVTNQDGAGVTLNYTKSTGDNTITLGTGGQTLNLLGSSSAATTITGGAAVDTINLQTAGSGSETLIETGANMSNKTQVDVVGNFNATGTDYFKTGVNAASVGSYIIVGNVDTSNYLASITTALSFFLNNTGQAYLITIQTGTAAGTYLFQNTGSDTSQFDSTDFFVQLTGTVGTISTGNLIA